jgi:hypothetical protein
MCVKTWKMDTSGELTLLTVTVILIKIFQKAVERKGMEYLSNYTN